jgi:site-specific recombinase
MAELSAEVFASQVAPHAAKNRALRQLFDILSDSVADTQSARIAHLQRLMGWVRSKSRIPPFPNTAAKEPAQVTRLRCLAAALESFEPLRSKLSREIYLTLNECSGINFLACLGLPGDRGFLAESVDRLTRRLLPEPVDRGSLTQLMGGLFPHARDIKWLAAVPESILVRCGAALALQPQGSLAQQGGPTLQAGFAPLGRASLDASALLATRISAVGLSEAIRMRSPTSALQESPFFQLPRAVDAFMSARRSTAAATGEDLTRTCQDLIDQCSRIAQVVVSNLEERGVSIDVVYRIELITKSLDRLSELLRRLAATADTDRYVGARNLLIKLLSARLTDRSLSEIARSNLHLLARKIIERAGHSGEHYITSTRAEYFKMLVSAGGGGVLTTVTATLKFLIGWGHFAPFVEGMLSATNYAGSFVLMQLLGLTLATKQPSMTAAALAASLKRTAGHPDLTELVTLIARITRSQLAAAIGNIGLVIPASLALDFMHRLYVGRSFLDPSTADYVLHSLHPAKSGTIFFAALTGVLLWTSSIGAGWLENWVVYHRVPEAIAEHRFGRWLGRGTMRSLSQALSHHVGGIGGNCTLGFLLGMTPVMGKFLGLPLDVRHVTLSTGALTLAVSSLGPSAVGVDGLLWSALGIVIIGCLNFGVSFVLALAVALRAREVDQSDQVRLLRSVTLTFLRSPKQFFSPPSSQAPTVHGPVSVRPPPR